MNLADLFLVLVVLLSVLNGRQTGFIAGSLDLLSWIGSLVAGFFFYPFAGAALSSWFPALGVWTMPLAFLLVIIIGRILFSILISMILQIMSQEVRNNGVNRFLGIIPGFIKGLIYAAVLSALLMAMPLWEGLSESVRNSRIANELAGRMEWVDERLSPVFDDAVNQSLNKLMVKPESEKSIALGFTLTDAKVRPDLENKMLSLVNNERRKEGLDTLAYDAQLTEAARKHSEDMLARGYFSHVSPEGKDPFDRLKAAGISFMAAGENIALAPTLSIAHEGLMNSPGHRANILNTAFGKCGIGIIDAGMYGLMITQEFRN